MFYHTLSQTHTEDDTIGTFIATSDESLVGIEPSQVAVMARSSTLKSEIVLGENVQDDFSTTQRTDLKKHATVTSILKTVASTKVLILQIGIQDCFFWRGGGGCMFF